MLVTGRCYCGAVKYRAEGEPVFKGQCHCRECQYITGGSANVVMGMPDDKFEFTQGQSKSFTRSDIENPATREFCPDCGTHLLTRSERMPGVVLLKVGTFDDPSVFGQPDVAIFTAEKQSFHVLSPDVPAFERGPGQ